MPAVAQYTYQPETRAIANALPAECVSAHAHSLGLRQCEPLIVMMDALISYAKAHRKAFKTPLSEDYILGPQWLEAAKAVRALLDGNGAIANVLGRTTDSKDNGAVEAMFWSALELAGFTEETANL